MAEKRSENVPREREGGSSVAYKRGVWDMGEGGREQRINKEGGRSLQVFRKQNPQTRRMPWIAAVKPPGKPPVLICVQLAVRDGAEGKGWEKEQGRKCKRLVMEAEIVFYQREDFANKGRLPGF